MAAPATSLSTFSILPLRSRRFSLLIPIQYSLSSPLKCPYLPLSLPSTPTKLSPLLCAPSDDLNIQLYGSDMYEYDVTYAPPEAPEGFVEVPGIDDGPLEDEDDITLAYEQIYGPAYSGVSVLGNDGYMMDYKARKETNWEAEEMEEKIKDEFEEEVVQVRKVTKVVKGGKQFNFRVVVVVGDKLGMVGVGVGKAKEVAAAIRKSATNARRNVVRIPLTKYMTFPHRADGKFGAAKVMLRPAAPGSGLLAGGSVRVVLEMAGVLNALGKQLGSDNPLNNARATIVATQKMMHYSEVAAWRGIPMEELWK